MQCLPLKPAERPVFGLHLLPKAPTQNSEESLFAH